MDVVVTGIGLVSALGTLPLAWKRLLAGESAINHYQPFPELPPLPLALVGDSPGLVNQLAREATALALADAELVLPLPDCSVVIGSSRGMQAQWEKLTRVQATERATLLPSLWLETLPHAAAIDVARYIETTATVLSPMAACATGLWAIAQGYELIRTGQCQRVLVGAAEAPVTPLTIAGFDRMGALAKTGAFPFDCQRQGLVLGEGGAVLVLESAELAASRQARVYGRILGFGLSADGYHVSAPEPGSRGAIAAVKTCLKRSHLLPSEIDYVHAHGTATQLNDQNEAHLLSQLFPAGVAVSSTKGATGHTIGASGVFGVVFCLLAMRDHLLPPCVGLQNPEFALDFVTTARPASVNHVLCLSFGFGGQNAAIALGR